MDDWADYLDRLRAGEIESGTHRSKAFKASYVSRLG